MSNRPKVRRKPKQKTPTVINVVAVRKEYLKHIKVLKNLKSKYEMYIEKNQNNKNIETQIKVLEYQKKLYGIVAEIKAKEQYISFFDEHDVRNRTN
ncbi:MAG: hypothetical protein DRJ01_08865 [Bacteroidetes bacterium]|nr:MAG: hypothetical protein DRJ01_08865 [Bacteroidota bacterium]